MEWIEYTVCILEVVSLCLDLALDLDLDLDLDLALAFGLDGGGFNDDYVRLDVLAFVSRLEFGE